MSNRAQILAALLRVDYPTFVRKVFPIISGGRKLSHDRYVDVLFQAAMDVYDGTEKRQVVNLPPRHGKTFAFSVPLAAWWIAHRPNDRIMVLSFRESLACQIVDSIRHVFREAWFKQAFPDVKIQAGYDRFGDFRTTAGGRVFARHLGRGITGEGAELILIDDPCDISDAASPDALAAVVETFDNVVRNRLNDPLRGCIIIVGHRVHARDLSGHVLGELGWAHV